jgi:hypothetical protein
MLNPDDATHLAEQATLGALILDPSPLPQLRAWLRRADFADALHGQIYSVLCERHTAGEPIGALAMGEALVGRAPGRSAAIQVHDLLQAAPCPGHVLAYARAVAEGGLRREIAGLGVLLRAGALQSALSGESVPMTSTCTLVDAGLLAVAHRWDVATGSRSPLVDATPIAMRPALRNPDLRLGADRLLRTYPERDADAEQAHEAVLVGSLIAHPKDIALVAACLPPIRVSSPRWRTVYGATLELAELGQPVDLVTVAGAVARLSHHGQASPTLRELRDVVGAARFTSPRDAERHVWIDQMRRIADHGADQLRLGANNPGLQVPDLVDTGRLVTTALREAAGMLPEYATDSRPRPLTVLPLEAVRGPVAR